MVLICRSAEGNVRNFPNPGVERFVASFPKKTGSFMLPKRFSYILNYVWTLSFWVWIKERHLNLNLFFWFCFNHKVSITKCYKSGSFQTAPYFNTLCFCDWQLAGICNHTMWCLLGRTSCSPFVAVSPKAAACGWDIGTKSTWLTWTARRLR